MHKKKQNPFLYFNFINSHGDFKPLQFTNPLKVLSAQTLDEVIPCLEEVDKAINDGYYAAGYISYEAASAFNQDFPKSTSNKLPLLWFGIFTEPTQKDLQVSDNFHTNDWKPTISITDYYKNIDKIHDYIKSERTEQVNYTIHLKSKFTGNPIAFYKQLEQAQSANYSAYLDIGDFSILSASPELFFKVENERITTKPMKGTIGRANTYSEDIKNAQWLKASKKNRFENRLIVDLMCNELTKIAIPNTVKVPHLYTIEKYPTVYQMTSTVSADIRPNVDFTDIFKALFPCGSITGAPKKDTMDIISMLETDPREIYCGALGWIAPNKEAIFNVPIRTVVVDKQNESASYGVGGAITKDSTKEDEYEEILIKARLLTKKPQEFKLLESLGLINGEYLVFQEHLNRLTESSAFFDFKLDLNQIKIDLKKISKRHPIGKWKIRLLLSNDGKTSVETEKLSPFPKVVTSTLSDEHICKDDLFLYHKTTNRKLYNKHREKYKDLFDVLLWNENYEVTEFTMGNIVVDLNGKLYTPPVECGLLAGTFRESLLQKEIIEEQKIMVNELKSAQKVWFINSVRGWVPINIIP